MNKLYIIGNGFDRYHELATGYCDFHEFIINNQTDLENHFEEYFQLRKGVNNLWSDFEEDLGTFNWMSFFDNKNRTEILDENFKPSLVFGLEDDLKQETEELVEKIRDAFESWLNNINLETVEKKLDLEEESIFVNFNYTLTLEKVYKIPIEKIFHIHGDVENNKYCLIFGHNQTLKEQSELDENGYSNRTMFSDSESAAKYPFHAFHKPVKDIIEENKNVFKSLRQIKKIIILGHSLNRIDIPYFEEIKKHTRNPIWQVSFHKAEEKEMHLNALQEIGVEKSFISFFKMNEMN